MNLHLKAELENLRQADAQNRAQKEKWNLFQKYVRSPFSRFNFDMAVAFFVQEKHLPKFFQDLGERRLDAALEISPDSRDAWLLKGWYLYSKDDADHAVEAVRKVLDGDAENSNAWLALGFFLAKAGDADGAVAAFEKVTRTLPGLSEAGSCGRVLQAVEGRGKKLHQPRTGNEKGKSFSKLFHLNEK